MKPNVQNRHDNDLLQPSGAGCNYNPNDNGDVYVLQQTENEPRETNLQMSTVNHMCLLCSECS